MLGDPWTPLSVQLHSRRNSLPGAAAVDPFTFSSASFVCVWILQQFACIKAKIVCTWPFLKLIFRVTVWRFRKIKAQHLLIFI